MFRLILLILFILLVLAVKFVDWKILLVVGVAVIILSKFVAKRAVLWLFSMPFRAKGKVLRNAAVEVHSIRPAAAPVAKSATPQARLAGASNDAEAEDDADPDEEADDEPDVVRDYYEIDVTITPQTPTGPFLFWDFSEVTLVQPGKRWDDNDDTCRVTSVDMVREGTVLLNAGEKDDDDEDDDGTKVGGPRRLRMLIGVKPGVRDLVFNYYFEKFGKLSLTDG